MNSILNLYRRADPRYFIIFFLASFCVYAITSPGFSRSPAQWMVTIGTCVGLDYLFLRFKKVPIFPLSGLITSMGTLLLVDSPSLWAYFFVSAVAIFSKNLLTLKNGVHIFNPNNFGLVVGLLLLPELISTNGGRWGGSFTGLVLLFALGVLVCVKANRWALSLSFVSGFALFGFLRAWLVGAAPMVALMPMTGAAFQLFTFFMVTDPRTTPRGRWGQAAFGLVVAALDAFLRFSEIRDAPFYTLVIVCGFVAAFRDPGPDRRVERAGKAAA